jgi:DNA repair protein RadA/Sms
VLTAALQGSRVMLVEVQALTASSVIGAARRKVSGVSGDRVGMIIAVLEKRAEMRLAAEDVFVNVAGGVRIDEPGADLAVALAVASAARGVVAGREADGRGSGLAAVDDALTAPGGAPAGGAPHGIRPIACFGEIGLTGELRSVGHPERRLAEAAKFGLAPVVAPTGAGRGATEAATLRQALKAALGGAPRARAA